MTVGGTQMPARVSTVVQQICVKYQKNCGIGGKSTKIGTDHAEYTGIYFSYSAKPDF